MGTASAEAGVARDESVTPERTEAFPVLFTSLEHILERAAKCCGVKIGREGGEEREEYGVVMHRVGGSGRWLEWRSLGRRKVVGMFEDGLLERLDDMEDRSLHGVHTPLDMGVGISAAQAIIPAEPLPAHQYLWGAKSSI
jgi:hypothetical protein